MTGPDFFLGARLDTYVTDFDGQLRSCFLVDKLRPSDKKERRIHPDYWWVRVEPPITLAVLPARGAQEVLLTSRARGETLRIPRQSYQQVALYEILDFGLLSDGTVEKGSAAVFGKGEIARLPSHLSPSEEQNFERSFCAFEQFVKREGHCSPPVGYSENGRQHWVWVANIKYLQLGGRLRPEWAERLEALPGWKWLKGDNVYLLDQYAKREGHTDVPFDHLEEGVSLGEWLRFVREGHAKGGPLVPNEEEVRRFESIPHWHW